MADTDPAELERQIERTRAELAQTVDAIADRVSPKRVAARGVAKVRANAEHLVAQVGDMVGGVAGPKPVKLAGEPEDLWADDRPDLAPILIGVGAVLALGAVVVLWRRRRR
jgi:LPXTG-motif cell wall-anchored protein